MSEKNFQHRCIFHIPYKIDPDGQAAPMLRPKKMLEGFEQTGYRVDVVEGYSNERKAKIREIKKKIKDGVHYDFLYAESSTMATALTDMNHIPTHPFMDFAFFRFVKKHGIRIGLFYRDIYWKFDIYKKSISWWKAMIGIGFYKFDLRQYYKLLDKLYLPSDRVYRYLKNPHFDGKTEELPSGCESIVIEQVKNSDTEFAGKVLTVFYVGGLGGQYQIAELMKAVQEVECCHLIICCRRDEWEREQEELSQYLSDNIEVVHKKNSQLDEYYSRADICSLMFQKDIYIEIAMPYKAFEYLANEKPILATKDTAIGDFVEKEGIGWAIEYESRQIRRMLETILADVSVLAEKRQYCIKSKERNTWRKRAEKVERDLCPEKMDTEYN